QRGEVRIRATSSLSTLADTGAELIGVIASETSQISSTASYSTACSGCALNHCSNARRSWVVQSLACSRIHQCAAASVMASYSASLRMGSLIGTPVEPAFYLCAGVDENRHGV